MRKEILFAIFFGTIIGLIFTFGILRIDKVIKNKPNSNNPSNTAISADPNALTAGNSQLTLLKPQNTQVFGEDVIQVSGMTKSDSFIVATGGTSDLIYKSKSDGSFDFKYEIDPSLNFLSITSVTDTNERQNSKLEVIYSSEFTQKEDAEDISQKVDNKMDAVLNHPVFFKGTVTDSVNENLQIKTDNGEIGQIKIISGTTTFAKVGKTTTKISESDVAIGDYILALGYKKQNGVLEAVRILVTSLETSSEVKIFFGAVVNKNKADMDVDEKNTGEIDIIIDNNSKTYKGELENPQKIRFADIKENDLVIGTYSTTDSENTARRIYILESATPTPTPPEK